MKETRFRFLRILLPLAVAAMAVTACVEDEQAPFTGGDGQSGALVDVKLPSYGDFYPGSVVTLRGSGFSAADRVLVQNGYGDGSQPGVGGNVDYNGDGEPDVLTDVEADVLGHGENYLDFAVPGEIVWSEATVSIVRDGVKHPVGRLYVNHASVGYCAQDGNMTQITVYGGDFAEGDRVLLRSIGYADGSLQLANVWQEARVLSADGGQLIAEAGVLGEVQVFIEHNGERSFAGTAYADISQSVQFASGYEFYPGATVAIGGRCFLEGDRVALLDMSSGDFVYVDATVTGSGIEFAAPRPQGGDRADYEVYIDRGGIMISLQQWISSDYSINQYRNTLKTNTPWK